MALVCVYACPDAKYMTISNLILQFNVGKADNNNLALPVPNKPLQILTTFPM